MTKKDRRIRLILGLFFLAAAAYTFLFKAWDLYGELLGGTLFRFRNQTLPAFELMAHLFTGGAALVAAGALWARSRWGAGWCLFTMGLLLYGNLTSMGPAIYEQPALVVPMVFIVLVVLQSFSFLIRNTYRHHRPVS